MSCRQSFLKYWIKYSQCCVGNLAAASRHCCVGVLLIFLYATKLRFDIWWNVKSIMGWSWIGQIPHKFPRFIKCNAVVVLKRFYWKYWCVPRKLRQYIKIRINISLWCTAWKLSKCGAFSGPYFPVFGLNTEIYGVNIGIKSEYRKIRTRKNSLFERFSRSGCLLRQRVKDLIEW